MLVRPVYFSSGGHIPPARRPPRSVGELIGRRGAAHVDGLGRRGNSGRGNSGEMQRPMRSARIAATAAATYYVCMFPGLALASRHHQAPRARPGREGPGVGLVHREWLGNCLIGLIGMRHNAATHRVRRAAVCYWSAVVQRAPPAPIITLLEVGAFNRHEMRCASPTTDARYAPAPSLILFPVVAGAPGPGPDAARTRSPPPKTGRARQEAVSGPHT